MEKSNGHASQNPFSLSFGRKPVYYISRLYQTEEIVSDFMQEVPSSPIYMITGVRGSGKTVFMTSVMQEFEKNPEWIVLELNANLDLLRGLASSLYAFPGLSLHFIKEKIDLSFFGIGLSLEKAVPESDYDTALAKMLKIIKKQKKKVLVAIDEASDTEQMRIFASAFQILIRKELPIYLMMTGLYENIYDLQNEKNLTFLYRAPKLHLDPLNFTAVSSSYEKTLDITAPEARTMAGLVRGYPYAYQVLGYLYWRERPENIEEILPMYDQYLDEYVYSKIWSELSEKDKRILSVVEEADGSISEIRRTLQMPSNSFSVYRERLLRKGILMAPERGKVAFTLPRFAEFVRDKVYYEGL